MKSMQYVALATRSVVENGFPNVRMCETIRNNLHVFLRTETDPDRVKILEETSRLFTGAMLRDGASTVPVKELGDVYRRAKSRCDALESKRSSSLEALDRWASLEALDRWASLEALDAWLKQPWAKGMNQAQALDSMTDGRVHAGRIGFIAGYKAALESAKPRNDSEPITSRVECEWQVSWIQDHGDLFAKQYADFHRDYSPGYNITVRAEPYRITIVASIK